jgi:competence protein ComEA
LRAAAIASIVAWAFACTAAPACGWAAETDVETAAITPSAPEAGLLDINTASRARLESIRGIGPTLAASILAAREERPFADWSDVVRRVHGVGPASARRLSAAGLRVGGRAVADAGHEPRGEAASGALNGSNASAPDVRP